MSMEIARTILEQMGGKGFRLMCGVRNATAGPDFLQLRFKGSRKANTLKITLTAMDVYDMEFFQFRPKSMTCPKIVEFLGLYAEDLAKTFTEFTGLETRMVRVRGINA